jgi:hypothetical protein
VIDETEVDEKDQNALSESSLAPQTASVGDGANGNAPSVEGESEQDAEHISPGPADKIELSSVHATPDQPATHEPISAKRSQALDSNASGSQSLVPDTVVSVTLSEPDKVRDAVVPPWAKFADLSIEEKFAEAKLMDFEARDTYLRERCRAAALEVAHAESALDRATAIIETNLPFFLVHFDDLDAQGERSDLKGKVVGKTEWLRQNVPDLSKGTFYAALNAVKARYAEQKRLMLGGELPPVPQPKTRTNDLTPIQSEVVTALVGQGFKNKDAILRVKAADGSDFESLFTSALSPRAGGAGGNANTVTAPEVIHLVESEGAQDRESAESGDPDDEEESGEPEDVTEEPNSIAATEATETNITTEPLSVTTVTDEDALPMETGDSAADKLRGALANEPDRDRASELLTDYLQRVAEQFANDHIQITNVSAKVELAGRNHRIMPDDFLEKRGKDGSPALCKCTGVAEFMQRRRVKQWIEGKWGKEHVIFPQHDGDYRVISDEVAHRLAPGAFLTSSTNPEGL